MKKRVAEQGKLPDFAAMERLCHRLYIYIYIYIYIYMLICVWLYYCDIYIYIYICLAAIKSKHSAESAQMTLWKSNYFFFNSLIDTKKAHPHSLNTHLSLKPCLPSFRPLRFGLKCCHRAVPRSAQVYNNKGCLG